MVLHLCLLRSERHLPRAVPVHVILRNEFSFGFGKATGGIFQSNQLSAAARVALGASEIFKRDEPKGEPNGRRR